jgi:hypothetical protein
MKNIAAILLISLLVASDAEKPILPAPYWVPGLTLPDDSKVVRQSEHTTSEPHTLTLHFDNPSEWATVSSHFKEQLTKEGYHKVLMPPGTESHYVGWSYAKRGAYFVSLRENTKLIAVQRAKGLPLSSRFRLHIMEWHKQ